MTPYTVTPGTQNSMPRQQGLLRRGGRYYCNIKVPKTLREALGKEHIREALGTSDYREACRRVGYANVRWKAFFEEEQRKGATLDKAHVLSKPSLRLHLSEREAHEIATRHLIRLEREFREWWENEGRLLSPPDRQDAIIAGFPKGEFGEQARRKGIASTFSGKGEKTKLYDFGMYRHLSFALLCLQSLLAFRAVLSLLANGEKPDAASFLHVLSIKLTRFIASQAVK